RLANQLVDPSRPGDFNQSIMELGATICSPSNPGCSACPISSQCLALSISKEKKSVQVIDYPSKVTKPKPRHDFCAVCVVETFHETRSNSRYLLVKRPDEGLLAGLWEFPSVRVDGDADPSSRREAVDDFLIRSFGLDSKANCEIVSRDEIGVHVHVFTHIRLEMYVELMVLHLKVGIELLHEREEGRRLVYKYVDGDTLSSLGLTSSVRKVHEMIQKFKNSSCDSRTGKKKRKQK
ncbi:hypothetical protein M569_15093, partial [Genlisea aurea]